eukprot:6680799-Lingulodinium_polyedra.AAC.1
MRGKKPHDNVLPTMAQTSDDPVRSCTRNSHGRAMDAACRTATSARNKLRQTLSNARRRHWTWPSNAESNEVVIACCSARANGP